MKKRIIFPALLIIICVAAAAVYFWNTRETVNKIGILMPSRNEMRWQQDSDSLARQLQAKGYQVEIRNAEDDIDEQKMGRAHV